MALDEKSTMLEPVRLQSGCQFTELNFGLRVKSNTSFAERDGAEPDPSNEFRRHRAHAHKFTFHGSPQTIHDLV